MAPGKNAMAASKGKETPSFDALLQADRKRRKNEKLANEMLGKGAKKASGAGIAPRKNPSQTPSLASRVGVTKVKKKPRGAQAEQDLQKLIINAQRSTSATPKTTGGLHGNNPRTARIAQLPRTASASRIEPRGNRFNLRSDPPIVTNSQANIPGNAGNGTDGITIRGVAGPATVVAQNLAPGTTAQDLEAVMGPVGGEMIACNLLTSNPTVIYELVFAEREGAENVIATFNNQMADGRRLHVYLNEVKTTAPLFSKTLTGPAAQISILNRDAMDLDVDDRERGRLHFDNSSNARQEDYSDGRYGFKENGAPAPPTQPRRDNRKGRGGYRGQY